MRKRHCSIPALALLLTACQDTNAKPDEERWPAYVESYVAHLPDDMKPTCANPDLEPPAPKCLAAKGLTGDALICVDFAKLSGLTDQALAGWNFVNATNHQWEISTGMLQIYDFKNFADTANFRLPLTDLAVAANQKYQSVTLAVVQTVDLDAVPASLQTEQVYFGVATAGREFTVMTGKTPRQHNIYEITRTDLGKVFGVGTSFQPLVQVSGAVASGSRTGVHIESIAVMGNP